jgi:phenylalanine-4-hydroxylase
LSTNNSQLLKFGKDRFPDGFSSPVGKLRGSSAALEDMDDETLREIGIEIGKYVLLNFEHNISVEGIVRDMVRSSSQKLILLELHNTSIYANGKVIHVIPSYAMAIGKKIVSVFAGPADVEAFEPTVMVPHEKMHKFQYDERALQLQEFYRIVRRARTDDQLIPGLYSLWEHAVKEFPDDWLLSLEILEILLKDGNGQHRQNEIQKYLEEKRNTHPPLANLIANGLNLLRVTPSGKKD